jgi:opacity protein-like surface antigen
MASFRRARFKSDVYGAIYGRVGVANGNALFYGKGGVASLNAKASTIDPCAGAPGCGSTTLTMTGDKVMVGWSAGAGIEWMVGAG